MCCRAFVTYGSEFDELDDGLSPAQTGVLPDACGEKYDFGRPWRPESLEAAVDSVLDLEPATNG